MPRAVVTVGVVFLGSHLCKRLLDECTEVVALDTFLKPPLPMLRTSSARRAYAASGSTCAVRQRARGGRPGPEYRVSGVARRLPAAAARDAQGQFHRSPARPAKEKGTRFLLTSTSETHGDPRVHP